MKHLRVIAAALFAAAAAQAQSQGTPVDNTVYVQGDKPVASAATGIPEANAQVANLIAQELAGDSSLGRSKITVSPFEEQIVLTGVTPTLQQQSRAMQVATNLAGQGNVINALTTEQVFIDRGVSVTPSE